jgi:hypothetical protein
MKLQNSELNSMHVPVPPTTFFDQFQKIEIVDSSVNHR